MPKTPKEFIKYMPKKGAKPCLCKATILDAGFRRRVNKDTGEVEGEPYISIGFVTDKGDSCTARLHLTGDALPITKRTLAQLGAKFGKNPETGKPYSAQEFAESLAGVETTISIVPQRAIDIRTNEPAVGEDNAPLEPQDNVSIRTNDFEAGEEIMDLLAGDEAEEAQAE